MEFVTCPNCGSQIKFHGFIPAKVKCRSCKVAFDVEYEDENGTVYPGGWKGFSQKHPKFVKALGWTATAIVLAGGVALTIASKLEDAAKSSHDSEDFSSTGIDDASYTPEQQSSDCSDNYDDDWGTSSFGSECCRTCGNPLAGSSYTLPWEDDDNELGYWKCDNCGAINYDWDSGDD